jgi:hypothetical protein
MSTLSNAEIEKLKNIAGQKMASEHEDFDPCDFSGGNFDDAYYMGTEDGEISLARDILSWLNIEY